MKRLREGETLSNAHDADVHIQHSRSKLRDKEREGLELTAMIGQCICLLGSIPVISMVS